MPRLSRLGDVVSSPASAGIARINGVAIAETGAGNFDWIDDDTVGGQIDNAGVWETWSFGPTGRRKQRLSSGASEFAGGGGGWSLFLGGAGVSDSEGFTSKTAGLLTRGDDCARLYVADRNNPLMLMVNGVGVFTMPQFITSAASRRGRHVICCGGNLFDVATFQPFVSLAVGPQPRCFRIAVTPAGRIFAIHNDGDRLVVYQLVPAADQAPLHAPLSGWVLSTDGRDNMPDIIALDETHLVAVSAIDTGETEVRTYTIDTTSATVDLRAAPISSVVLPTITYPAIVAPFFAWCDRSDYGKTDVPTNGIVLDTLDWASIPPRSNGRPKLILDGFTPPDQDSPVPDAQLVGRFASLEGGEIDPAQVDAFVARNAPMRAECVRRNRPLVYNLDGGHWPESTDFLAKACAPAPGLEIVPMLELYPFKVGGQTPSDDDILAEWDRNLAFLKTRFGRLAVAPSVYTQWQTGPENANYPPELIVRLFTRGIALAVKYGAFLFDPFSIGRPSGVLSYPDQFWPLIHALAAACVQGDPSLDAVLPAPSPVPVPVPVPRPAPRPDEDFMPALPFRCYALSHLSTPMVVNFDAPGPKKLDLHYPTIGFGAYQEVEVAASKATPGKVTVRFVGSNQFVRVDRGDLAKNPATLERALSIWDATRDDADTEWQHGELVGSYVHYYGDGPNGLHGVLYTLTLVDGTGQLFRPARTAA